MSTDTFGSAGAIIGGAVGTAVGGPVGGAIGGALGGGIGTAIGNNVNGPRVLKGRTGRRLGDLAVQSSAYGDMIPILYGSGRLAGNVIWAQEIKEVETVTQNNSGGGKGGGGQKTTSSDTTYSYFTTLAIAITEGEVDELVRIWADAGVINQSDYTIRFYKGTETQNPDSFIESIEGVGNTPAYRGISYIVLEDFPLDNYGNRIPNFTFEVRKTVNTVAAEDTPETLLTAVNIIPGAGEFVYDDTVQNKIPGQLVGSTWVQTGNSTRINQNNREGKADALVSLDQLELTCPNVNWVAVVVVWFGNSIDAGDCIIQPGVEYKNGANTAPDTWAVGSYTRSTARQITLIGGSPQYGGTPSDASLLRYLTELKNRGFNIMFNPMVFMDVANKPWRGRITGTAAEVSSFFVKTNGYNAFINHYSNLVKNHVDAFIIGSELIGLTSVQDSGDDSFPAVDELVSLAATVKTTVGASVKVTYAADWSEYHHTTGGWYNLDPLWASSNIDFVGIDAYFPLTDEVEPVAGFTETQIRDGWTSGEGYDWYYSDPGRTVQTSLADEYAWKNIAWWWNNTHTNPDMSTTAWTAQMKKIWFTEFGFPSVDGCTNQPNVFYDPDSSENGFPYHSRGRVDFRAQRNALTATLKEWKDSTMIEHMFVWTWDARPFPFWPDLLNIWSDGNLWKFGHWINGKLGASSLAAIVSNLSTRAGLNESQINVSNLTDIVEGYIIKEQTRVRDAIDDLRAAYFFDAVESGSQIKYVKRGGISAVSIAENDMVPVSGKVVIEISRLQEFELPQKIDVNYLNKVADYQTGNQHAQRLTVSSQGFDTIGLPIVMSNQQAKNIADIALYNAWKERSSYEITLPIEYSYLEPTDIITITVDGHNHIIRIEDTRLIEPLAVKISGVIEDIAVYDFYTEPGEIPSQTDVVADPGDTVMSLLDLPALPTDSGSQAYIRYAVSGQEAAWNGAVIYRSDDNGANYSQIVTIPSAATIGTAVDVLASGTTDIFDEANTVTVSLYGDNTLESVSELAVLNGANAALLGSEIIQFKTATLVSSGKYTLSGLLRGRLGTEGEVSNHAAGEEFVLLDNKMVKEPVANSAIGISKLYKGVSVGHTLAATASESFTYNANALKPFSPVHIAGSRDGSSNLTITWIRRTRIDGGWRDNVDAALGETSEEYEVDILNGATVVRTISGLTSTTASYTAAQQTTDFGSPQNNIDIKVYQISDVVGRGRAGTNSV